MAEAGLALFFAYLWVGALRAVERFERPLARPEYETAQPETAAGPGLAGTLKVVLFFPFLRGFSGFWRATLAVLVHAGLVLGGALILTRLLARPLLALAAVGVLVFVVVFFYILAATTRVR